MSVESGLASVEVLSLCNALGKLRATLEVVEIFIESKEGLAVFAQALSSNKFPRLLTLKLSTLETGHEYLEPVFQALKGVQSLRCLSLFGLNKQAWKFFCSLHVVEAGWIALLIAREGEIGEDDCNRLRLAAAQNERNHRACFNACVALLWTRKTKRAMQMLQVGVVQMIAKQLSLTRNDEKWSDVNVVLDE